ncbi:MAG: cyanophycin synthetase, partial [Candidatus Kerfeldbacteria bacterium]
EVALLTNVSLDHCDLLGNTVEEIAVHKAGIIKEGSALFSTETKPEVRRVFNEAAARTGTSIQYIEPTQHYETSLPGEHQQWNAALAAAAARHLGVADTDIAHGIKQTHLPARIEQLQEQPRVILDGAHSPAKIEALVQALEQFRPWNTLHVLFAAKETKELAELIRPLCALADTVTCTEFQLIDFGSAPATEAADIFRSIAPDIDVQIEPNPRTAIDQMMAHTAPNDLVLITGSLYLAGPVRERWIPEQDILKARSVFPA